MPADVHSAGLSTTTSSSNVFHTACIHVLYVYKTLTHTNVMRGQTDRQNKRGER